MTDYLNRAIDVEAPDFGSGGGGGGGVWDEVSLWGARFGILLLDEIRLAPGMRVLDVGSGTGFPLFELAHVLGTGCELVGVDLWRVALARAAHKRRAYEATRIALVQADGARLPFGASVFDLVVSNLGVNNFADPDGALGECARVLRPGGRLTLTTNPRGHFRELYAAFRDVLAELDLDAEVHSRLIADENHRPDIERLREMLARAGLSVARTVERETELRYLDGSAFLRHWLIRLGFIPGWRKIVGNEGSPEERRVFERLEARLNAVAAERGELRMTLPLLYIEAGHRP